MDRTIPLASIRNARDLGGLTGEGGHALRPGRLLRSANLSEASEADLHTLKADWRLALVIDLRTTLERQQMPDRLPEGTDYAPLPVFDDRVIGVSHEKGSEAERVPLAIPDMRRVYRRMSVDDACRPNLSASVRRVMEHDFDRGSVLWHCSEGKDRCGLLSAVLLMALGTAREQIMEDYLLTNRVNEARSEAFYRELLAKGRSEEEARNVRLALLAKPEYLQSVFDAVDELYGGAEAYLLQGLELPPETVERFRETMLE